jgi:hypothetical protein
MITSGLTNKARFFGNGAIKFLDAHKYKGSLKSSMGSIIQIYSSTQGEHKNTNKTLAIVASLSITPVYQQTQQRNSDGSDLIQVRKIE